MERRSFLRALVAGALLPALSHAEGGRTAYSFLTGRRPSIFGTDPAGRQIEIPFRDGVYSLPPDIEVAYAELNLSGPIVVSHGARVRNCIIRPANDYTGVLLDGRSAVYERNLRPSAFGKKGALISDCFIDCKGCSIIY